LPSIGPILEKQFLISETYDTFVSLSLTNRRSLKKPWRESENGCY